MPALFNRRRLFTTVATAGGAWLAAAKTSSALPAAEAFIGKSKWDLDTPALLLDLDKMESNLKAVHQRLEGSGIGVRPHIKTHKCPALAHMQMAAGALGVCAAKLSEAAVMLENGIHQVLMTGVNVTASKIEEAMLLRREHPGFIQAVDHADNAQALQDAAKAAGIVADIVVDIDVFQRSGAPVRGPALELAQLVDRLPNLRFRGVLAYDGPSQHIHGHARRKEQTLKAMEPIVETCEMIKAAGLNLEIFSGAGTGTYDMMDGVPGFTDVQVGSYLFMDCQYLDIGGRDNETVYEDFAPSLTVLTTILNTDKPNRLVTDAGSKALTLNKPPARVIGDPGLQYLANSDEYGILTFENPSSAYRVGDPVEVIIPHCDPVVNLYDHLFGIRGEKVESVLPILARGKSQ